MNTLFTIGYGNLEIKNFIEIVKKNNIEIICDIRSQPYSSYSPAYSQEPLKKVIKENSIKYIFMGDSLGGRSEDMDCYENNRINYEILSQKKTFQDGLDRLLEGLNKYKIAIMCSEKDPEKCHRTLLVARYIKNKHSNIVHIHHNDSLEKHSEFEKRIINLNNKQQQTLLNLEDEETTLSHVYKKLSKKAAYKRNDDEKK